MLKLSLIFVLAVATCVTCDQRHNKAAKIINLLSKISKATAHKRLSLAQGKNLIFLHSVLLHRIIDSYLRR